MKYIIGIFIFLLFSNAFAQDMNGRDPKVKIVTPPGQEPENDYNNDYDLLEDDNGDDEEDN